MGTLIAGVGGLPAVADFVATSPLTRSLRARYVNAEADDAIALAGRLGAHSVASTLHFRDQPVEYPWQVQAQVRTIKRLADKIAKARIVDAEIAVKMEQLGYHAEGREVAEQNLLSVVEHATRCGVPVTLDMEGPEEVEDTLAVWTVVQGRFPDLGIAIQAYLPRSLEDCRMLGSRGARVRLCKGGYAATGAGTLTDAASIDRAYVHCLRVLMNSAAYPMVATHDRRLLAIAVFLAQRASRPSTSWEIQTLQGVAPRLVESAVFDGLRVRCYLPFGPATYTWLLRRIAERPANLMLLARGDARGDVVPSGMSRPSAKPIFQPAA